MKNVSQRWITLILIFCALFVLPPQARSAQQAWTAAPDLVLETGASTVIPAGSSGQGHRYELATPYPNERWIRALEFHPGDPNAVRSAFFTVEKTGQWIGAWSPGVGLIAFPDTVAASLPLGSKIILDIYYQTEPRNGEDSSALGLFFTDKKPTRPLTGLGVETHVELPPSPGEFRVHKEFTLIADSYVLAVRPEMDVTGRSVEVSVLDAAGNPQLLMALDEFRKDGKNPYVFEQPMFMTKGTRIVASATFQNTSGKAAEGLFKLTMSMYPSSEYRPASVAPLAPTAKKPAAKKAPAKKKPWH